mmetsp:Transcript_4397/g.13326  ORF Transcript_4397/g.13326 Transcript_4397/m.13326 type:complete len:212 (-) Transcript_4397:49-684(-)
MSLAMLRNDSMFLPGSRRTGNFLYWSAPRASITTPVDTFFPAFALSSSRDGASMTLPSALPILILGGGWRDGALTTFGFSSMKMSSFCFCFCFCTVFLGFLTAAVASLALALPTFGRSLSFGRSGTFSFGTLIFGSFGGFTSPIPGSLIASHDGSSIFWSAARAMPVMMAGTATPFAAAPQIAATILSLQLAPQPAPSPSTPHLSNQTLSL